MQLVYSDMTAEQKLSLDEILMLPRDDEDAHRLSRLVLERFSISGGYAIRYWRQQWMVWDGTQYRPQSDDFTRAQVNMTIEYIFLREAQLATKKIDPSKPVPKKKKVTRHLVSDTLEAMRAIVAIPDFVDTPNWIGGQFKAQNPRGFIPVKNGIIRVSDLDGESDVSLIPHSHDWFCETRLPSEYDPAAECPRWHEFLQKNLEGDEEQINLLREWFGYCLTPTNSMQKFLILEGEGRNGKSVVCAALTALLGRSNVSHVTLESFGKSFALHSTMGKLANIVPEVGDLDKVAEGAIKSFTSGDRIEVERKFKSSIQIIPTARLMIATNNLPRLKDHSFGIWRRMLLLPMQRQISDAERIPGMDNHEYWKSEAAGILNWALYGLVDLLCRGEFIEPESSKAAKEAYRDDVNPSLQFIKDRYEEAADTQWVACKEEYAAYRKWCDGHGYSPTNDANYWKEVRRHFRKCRRDRMRDNSGTRFYAYRGISVTPDNSMTIGEFN